MEIGFNYGALSEDLKIQAKNQGVTLTDVKLLQKLFDGLIRLRISGMIADGEYDKILKRFHKKVISHIKCKND